MKRALLAQPVCEECSDEDEDGDAIYEGSSRVALVVSVALFAAAFAQLSVCADKHVCESEGTCVCPHTDTFPSCAFKTALTPAYSRMLLGKPHNSSQDNRARRVELERGVCQFGLREDVDVSGNVVCRRKRFYPQAMNLDILGAADEASPHRRWCGKWIDSGTSTLFGADRWGWFDEALVERAVERVTDARGATSLGIDAFSKFRSACRAMIAAGATSPATMRVYAHLRAKLDAAMDAPSATGANGSVAAVAVLAAHHCNAPLGVEVRLYSDHQTNRERFFPVVFAGQLEAPSVLREAMYAAGASSHERRAAADFSSLATALALTELDGVPLPNAKFVFSEALKGSWLASSWSDTQSVLAEGAWHAQMKRFVLAQQQLGAASARAYLHGAAAICATMVRTVSSWPSSSATTGPNPDASSGHNVALTRLSAPQWDRFAAATPETTRRAGRMGISAMAAAAAATSHLQTLGSHGSARQTCQRAASVMFPDAMDRAAFATLVTPTLYGRLEHAVATIRAGVVHALGSELIGGLFNDTARRDAAIKHVSEMKVTIPGARVGTWAGRTRAFRSVPTSSDDGALIMMMKQANAVFLDTAARAVLDEGMWEMQPIYVATERNAYFYPASSSYDKISSLLPGLISPPFADERMDNKSLLARVGFVIGHELGHVTFDQSEWNHTHANELLSDYPASERTEGAADLVAVAALMHTDQNFTAGELCGHVSQLWCGRKGALREILPEGARNHPPMNKRGDRMCRLLAEKF